MQREVGAAGQKGICAVVIRDLLKPVCLGEGAKVRGFKIKKDLLLKRSFSGTAQWEVVGIKKLEVA